VIGNFETGGDLTQYKDDYQVELQQIIDAKIEGKEVVARRGSAAEGGQPDGSAAPEPGPRLCGKKKPRESQKNLRPNRCVPWPGRSGPRVTRGARPY
jgi:hypothetical protein